MTSASVPWPPLSEVDREVVLLVAWEGLTPVQAATVLGLTSNAFSVRLHRARRRLDELLNRPDPLTLTILRSL